MSTNENDFYNPVAKPRNLERSNANRLAAEFDRVQKGFKSLPSKEQLAGGLNVFSAEDSSSAADAYVVVGEYPITEYVEGMTVRFFAQNTNTGASTVNVDGKGNKSIKALDGTALTGGEIVASRPIELILKGDNFILMNSAIGLTSTIFLSEAISPQSFEINAAIDDLVLPEASGGASPYTYAVTGLSTGLSFAAATRTISGTPTALGSSTVTYTITDANTIEFNVTFRIRIVSDLIELPDPDDRTLQEGSEYDIQLDAATGGTAPYAYQLSGLPEGLTFDADSTARRIDGSPTEDGVFIVTYSVTDDDEQTASQQFVLTVDSAAALSLTAPSDRTFVPNEPIDPFTLATANGGRQPYTYIVTGLSAGLAFDSDSLEVSGTPTEVGTNEVTYRVTDDAGDIVDQTFEIVIEPTGHRYVFVVDSRDTVTAAEMTSGTETTPTDDSPALPDWNGSKYIGVAQPQDEDDLNHISLSGLGNSISGFEKLNYTVDENSVTYEIWLGLEVQGGEAIGGQNLTLGS